MVNLENVKNSFNIKGEISLLKGGSQQVYKVGDYVLKQVDATSFEHSDSLKVINWLGDVLIQQTSNNYRSTVMLKNKQEQYVYDEIWTVWNYLEGIHSQNSDVELCIIAIQKYHAELAKIEFNDVLNENSSPWGVADKAAWGEKQENIQPQLNSLVSKLYKLRQPIFCDKQQVIHGDLNFENILIHPKESPAIIDLSPFWGVAEFALAIYANFIGPRAGDIKVLKHFEHIKNFDQLLIRASIRMLIVMSQINQLDQWDQSSEKKAAELIINYVSSKKD
ncbi:MAG: hypothetical protein HRU38_06750 [Saccharospirillaceae bacterium]|nr:hypothetical protein [Pseudomonadales bacterium]NRB78353.1 hypothetical protein [Saccharospirillaceae bacterium]